MPFLLYLAVIAAVLAILAGITARNGRDPDLRPFARRVTIGLAVVVAVCLFGASLNQVPVRNVGIITSFGKPTGGTTGAGLKLVWPWQSIDDWDAARQAYDHRGADHCVNVRIASQANACVEVLIEWQVKEDRAPEQWAAYKKEFALFVGRRVEPAITDAMNEVFAGYNPMANMDRKTGNLNVPLAPMSAQLKAALSGRIADDIEVLTVMVMRVNHDEKTQQSLDAYQQSINRGRVLDQDKLNAEKQKAITETNAQVPAVTRCLEIAEKAGKEPGLCLGGGQPVQVTNK